MHAGEGGRSTRSAWIMVGGPGVERRGAWAGSTEGKVEGRWELLCVCEPGFTGCSVGMGGSILSVSRSCERLRPSFSALVKSIEAEWVHAVDVGWWQVAVGDVSDVIVQALI